MMLPSKKLISLVHPTLHLAHPTLESFIWNTVIRAHVFAIARPAVHSPICIYLGMRYHGVAPDLYSFPFLLQSFDSPFHLHSGKQIHAQIFLFGLADDPFVQTSLINMYSSCDNLNVARQVFDEIPKPDLPSWNSMVNAYMKVGLIGRARNLFDKMPEKNVVSWSCMINGCVRCGEYKEALALFREMQMLTVNHVKPNEFTMSGVLSACGRLGALEQGKWAHSYIDRYGMEVDVVLGTALIDMYAKCGSIEEARRVFIKLGLVSAGKEYFRRMKEEFGITPLIQHYGCMVDLYGRAGLIDEAWNVIRSMPMEPDVLVWGALLSGSRMHGNIETCEAALKKLIELDPKNSSAYVLLSNVYAKMGRWTDVRSMRNIMERRGIKKVPGCSLVEVGGILHEFFVGDDSHPESREIYVMLDEIMKRLKREGYVGNTKEVLLDLDEEGKELALSLHGEKLAIAYCFLHTSPGTPIRIVKNLRICLDCHAAITMISRVFAREIVVRDCNRFHHFKNGACSCKDYW
ncbi:hypothetical protein SLEP1_g1332 [Rubroshorea leprosula]|uniref:DYW domain-containing protein n=1 Tax=Rubroshorea leprosula TaxID=152421 RepID=A0AAV5HDG7_9ROSI|nr:hypothetical protein SLEP1_g1332 [Rubroshorea leprosula]